MREEVYVYQEGFWTKDAELYKSIQSSRLDNLILPPGLKEAIRGDPPRYSTRVTATAGSTSRGSAD